MSRNREDSFVQNEYDEWKEYKKTGKKKDKHREEKDWKFDRRKDYSQHEDDLDYGDNDDNRKTRDR